MARSQDYLEDIGTINMLIEQDREEFRSTKNHLFNVSQYVIAIMLAALVLIINTDPKCVFVAITVLVGITLLFAYYIVLFFIYRKFIIDIRKCIEMRELFIKDYDEFNRRGYTILGNTDDVPDPKYKEKEPWIYLISVAIFWGFVLTVIIIKLSSILCVCK